MSAIDVELDLLKESMQIAKRDTVVQHIFNSGTLEGKKYGYRFRSIPSLRFQKLKYAC